jgi:RHS repeat-associated protein
MGPLPPTGQWVRLEVPASQVGLEGITVIGAGFNLYNGSATWNHSGMRDSSGNETVWIGDSLPTGAEPFTNNDTWTWTQSGLQSDFQYAGYYTHVPSTLNLTLYRAYDPNTAKWLSRDPLGDAEISQGPNLYEYANIDPVNMIDPFGLWQVNINIFLPEIGINITFGNNGGQWNAGAKAGPGEGLGISGNLNTRDTGCQQKGLHLDLGAVVGRGRVWNLTGSGNLSFGEGFKTASLTVSATGAAPGGGATVAVSTTNGGIPTISPTFGVGYGGGAFFGGGGHYTWGNSCP